MEIKPFLVEEWMNAWEVGARYNIAETCVDSVSLDELFKLTGENRERFLASITERRLTYGDIEGSDELKRGIVNLYKTIRKDNIVITHGAAGANHHVFYSLVKPGDRVISIMPTYQQLYSIPESYGADVKVVKLKEENGYLPDLNEIESLVTPETRLICINNPNNPTGALMSTEMLRNIIDIALKSNAYIMCDEVYRHLTQEDGYSESIADLYNRGISVSSMSKVFSLAGIRVGWICCHNMDFIRSCLSHRDYNLISVGMIDDAIASLALRHAGEILKRNRSLVRTNLEILDRWVASEKMVHYVKPKAGTTALVYYDYNIPSRKLCEEMYKQTGAFVTPGECFDEERCMRIGYAADTEVLKKGLAAISEYFRILEERK
ncbi:MAG: aminotransferase [Spirochaetales bacterium]|nr:aminotransferase [Spirochaetales bacterium]